MPTGDFSKPVSNMKLEVPRVDNIGESTAVV